MYVCMYNPHLWSIPPPCGATQCLCLMFVTDAHVLSTKKGPADGKSL